MFSLIVGFWKLFFRRSEFQVLIVGVDGAGKTSVLEQIKAIYNGLEPLPPGKIPPTVGLNIGRVRADRANLIFWDLGGARSLRSLWEKYYNEAHGLLYVVDAADRARLDESRDVLQQLMNNADLQGIPLLVLANKQDAEGAATAHEVQERFGLQHAQGEGGSSQPQNVLGVTAINGEGIEEGVRWLVETLKSSPRALALQADGPWQTYSTKADGPWQTYSTKADGPWQTYSTKADGPWQTYSTKAAASTHPPHAAAHGGTTPAGPAILVAALSAHLLTSHLTTWFD